MQTLQNFTGINNVQDREELKGTELTMASNVDIDISGTAGRRAGYAQASATQHANVWQASGGFVLATRGAAGDLVNVTANTVLLAALGNTRLWYCALPDGRTAYNNGVSKGIVNAAGTAATAWGVPIPAGVGAFADTAGNLVAGTYQYALTHTRLADGAESGPAYAAPVQIALGGLGLTALPVLAGHRTNVYLTSAGGKERFFAGSTVNAVFTFTGKNKDLALPCRTEFLTLPPAGKLLAFWRGRVLVAVGKVLFASRPHSWELFDLARDYKMFSANITLVQPVNGGIWVGTEQELAFLAGDAWDKLQREVKVNGPVVLGSGCTVPGGYLLKNDESGDRADGDCMVCIADGWLVGGTDKGELLPMTQDRYRTTATEVSSTFRFVAGIPQYIAAVQ